jgi:L-threonylcarbamoyladenylate synthase
LGANVFSPLGVARIFEVKKRPSFDPLIVHVSKHPDVEKMAIRVPLNAQRLMERFWPGPLSVVLLKREEVPDIVTAGLPTVALRMPRHPMALSLIELAGCPIAAPSANPFGYLSPTTAEAVQKQLGDQIDFILDGGPCAVGVESTIVSFVQKRPRLLRPGGVVLEEIESIIGPVEVMPVEKGSPSAPGMLPKHYAPRTPMILNGSEKKLNSYRRQKIGLLAFREPKESLRFHHIEVLSKRGDLREAAANLFAAIRRLDTLNLDLIVAEPIPEIGLGRAIMDRLRKASQPLSSPLLVGKEKGKGNCCNIKR